MFPGIQVVSGGINTDLNKDPAHDKNWRNFILAAKKQFDILNETCAEEKEWFVNKSSYLERANNELIIDTDSSVYKTAQQVYGYAPDYSKTVYRYIFDQIRPIIRMGTSYFSSNAHGNREAFIKEIESSAQELGITLRWFDSKTEFLHNLSTQPNGKPRKECSKIKRFYYYGHGYPGKLAIIYNINESKGSFVYASDFSIRDFRIPSLIKLETCHSASRKLSSPNQPSIAEEISKNLHSLVLGYDGKASYANISKTGIVEVGERISRNAVVEKHRLNHAKDTGDSYGYQVKIKYFLGGRSLKN